MVKKKKKKKDSEDTVRTKGMLKQNKQHTPNAISQKAIQ